MKMSIINQFIYEIMHKDTVVATINTQDGSVMIYEDYLPFDLFLQDNPQSIEGRVQNISKFKDWCSGRTLMMSQKHAKKICNALNMSQENSTENKAQIALAYHCSTLLDCYWVRQKNAPLQYCDVSLFQNTSRNLLTPVSLRGELGTVFQKKLKNWSDIGTDGTLAKSWVREKGTFFLYKTGDNIDGEILASKILDSLGVQTVSYEYDDAEKCPASKCACFTNEDVSFIPYRLFAQKYGLDAITHIRTQFLTEYANLAIATYLIGNEDLHDKNWGLLFDNNTKKIIGLAPLFDFDCCFLNYNTSKNLRFLPECVFISEDGQKISFNDWNVDDYFEIEGPTIEEVALELVPYSTINLNIDVSIIPEKYREQFAERITLLNLHKNKGNETERNERE